MTKAVEENHSHFSLRSSYVHVNNTSPTEQIVDELFSIPLGQEKGRPFYVHDLTGKSARTHFQSAMHEVAHWWQYSGTNFGTMLLYLHHQNLGGTAGSFLHMPTELRNRLLEKRLAGNPIIETNVEDWYAVGKDLKEFTDPAIAASCNRLFVFAQENSLIGADGINCVGGIFQDTLTQCINWLSRERTDGHVNHSFDWDETPYHIDRLSLVKTDFGFIHFHEIVEGQARALQMLFLLHRAINEDKEPAKIKLMNHIGQMMSEPGTSEYQRAIAFFYTQARRYPDSPESLRSVLTEFVILCDIALSGPTPLVVDETDRRMIGWQDISPPDRFGRLATIAKDFPLERACSEFLKSGDPSSLMAAIDELCGEANVEYLYESDVKLYRGNSISEIADVWGNIQENSLPIDDYAKLGFRQYSLDCHAAHQMLRRDGISMVMEMCLDPNKPLAEFVASKITSKIFGLSQRRDGHVLLMPPATWDHAHGGEGQISGIGRFISVDTMMNCMVENFFFEGKDILDIPFPRFLLDDRETLQSLAKKFCDTFEITQAQLQKMTTRVQS